MDSLPASTLLCTIQGDVIYLCMDGDAVCSAGIAELSLAVLGAGVRFDFVVG